MKSFKGFVKEEWNRWRQATDFQLIPKGRRKRSPTSQLCDWAKTSWDVVKQEPIVKWFKYFEIKIALDSLSTSFCLIMVLTLFFFFFFGHTAQLLGS